MVEVLEFRNLQELNVYIDKNRIIFREFEIIPVPRIFQHPQSKLFVNCISYVMIKN